MSTRRATAKSAKSKDRSALERAALASAAKAIAKKPGMTAGAALRKAGVKSAASIDRLSSILREKPSARAGGKDLKAEEPVKRGQPKSGAKPARQMKRRNGSDGTIAAVPPIARVAQKLSPGSVAEHSIKPAENGGAQMHIVSPMTFWADQQFLMWNNLIRWSPMGVMLMAFSKPRTTSAAKTPNQN